MDLLSVCLVQVVGQYWPIEEQKEEKNYPFLAKEGISNNFAAFNLG